MMEYGVENVDPKPLTLKQLKSNLRETLRKSGVLDTVKAQVRNEFIHGLGTKSVKDRSNSVIGNDIRERFTHSLVYHLMKNRDLKNSISVYLAECGLDPKNYLLAEKDLIQLVKFNRVVATYQDIHTKTDHEAADSIYSKDVIVSTELVKKNRTTALDFLVHFCLTINGDGSKEIETQTDMSGPSIREQLELDVRKMRDNYNETKDNEVLNPARTIEEKMIRYQRECEERLAVDVRLQVANIRENEIAKVKLEESQKARLAMEAYRKEVDDEYQHRLRSHIERETESSRRLSEQERQFQRNQYDARQAMQREIDDLRSRETALMRKYELESQGIKMLELRLKESLNMIESRERELASREHKMEEQSANNMDIAHRKAREFVQKELEAISIEKSSLMVERRKLDDEKAANAALIQSSKALRVQLQQALEDLIAKDDEILSIKRSHDTQEALRKAEDQQLLEMILNLDPNLSTKSRSQQMIALISKVNDLKFKISTLKDSKKILNLLETKEKEIAAMQVELDNLQSERETAKQILQTEIEKNRLLLSNEQAVSLSNKHKVEELSSLLIEKDRTIETLKKQIDGSNHQTTAEKRRARSSQLDKLNDTLGAGRSDHLVESMSSKIFTTIMDKMASNVSLNNRQSSSYNFLQNDRLDRCEFFQQQYPPVPVQYGLPSYGYYQTSSVPPMYQTAPQPVVGMQAQTYIPPTNPTPQVVYEGNGKPQTLDNVAAPTSGTNYGTSEKASSYGIAEDLQHITKNNNSPTATLTAAPLKTNDIGKQDNFAAAPVTYADSTQNPSDITRGTTGNTDSRLNELPIHDKYAIPALAPVSTASTGSSSPHTEMFPANTPVHSETHNNDFRSQQKSAIFVDSSKAQSREDSLHRPQSLYKVDNNLTSGYANDKFSYYDGDVKPNIIPLNDAPADLLNELQTIPDEVATTVVPNNDEARSAFILVGNTVQEAALVESNVITVGEEQKAKLHNGDLSFAKKQKEVEQDRAQENERETQRIAEELKLERIAKEQEVEAERIAKEKELALECAKQLEEAEFHAKHMEEKLAESKRLEKEREEEKQMEEARRAKEEAVEEEKRLEAERARIAEETEKKRIAQIEAEKKEEDDAAAISEARAKVLARRKQKQQRDGTASSSSSWPAFDDTTPRNSMDGNLGDTVKSMPSTNTLTARNSSDPVINIFNKTDSDSDDMQVQNFDEDSNSGDDRWF